MDTMGIDISKVYQNWKWESKLIELQCLLATTRTIQFMHIHRQGNKVADVLANIGVGAWVPFHAGLLVDTCDQIMQQ